MSNAKILELERELNTLRISALEEEIKKLSKKVAKLEKEEDDFERGNIVRLKDKNDNRILEVVRVTPKSLWLRHGDSKQFLKRKYKVKKIELNDE